AHRPPETPSPPPPTPPIAAAAAMFYYARSLSVPPGILDALHLSRDPEKNSYVPVGGGGFASTGRLTSTRMTYDHESGSTRVEKEDFFIKLATADIVVIAARDGTGREGGGGDDDGDGEDVGNGADDGQSRISIDQAEEMMRGEFAGLNAIADYCPGFCPRALAWGPTDARKRQWFLATEFLQLGGYSHSEGRALARRLAELHSRPAPPAPRRGSSHITAPGIGMIVNFAEETGAAAGTVGPAGESQSGMTDAAAGPLQFGFPVPTYCGDTRQPNEFRRSWATFFAEQRLLTILQTCEKANGADPALRSAVERTVRTVVPRLLADGHLGYDGAATAGASPPSWSTATCGPVMRAGARSSGPATTRTTTASATPSSTTAQRATRTTSSSWASCRCSAGSDPRSSTRTMKSYRGPSRLRSMTTALRCMSCESKSVLPSWNRNSTSTCSIRGSLLPPLNISNLQSHTCPCSYHRLNHHAIFGVGYRSGAMSTMKRLLEKYGDDDQSPST
ncbi:Fructosamine-3-kinase, partial [Ascosphaera acerosa]